MINSIVHSRLKIVHAEVRRRCSKLVVQGFGKIACFGQVIDTSDACAVDVQNYKDSSV